MYPSQPSSSTQRWGPLLDTGRCPSCRAPITGSGPELHCAACGLPLGGPAAAKLAALLAEADRTLGQLRNQRPAPEQPSRPPQDWMPFTQRQSPPGQRSDRPGKYGHYSLPPVQPLPSRQLPAASGAVILLSLGGLCLVVAALVFLSMSWTTLSLDAKVAVLAGVTALLGASATTVTRQGLRGSAETLWAITLVDLALDVWAARRAGLAGLDSMSFEVFSAAGAAWVAVAALACCLATQRSRLSRPLVSPQLALGSAGVLAVTSALAVASLAYWIELAAGAVGLLGLAMAGRAGALVVTARVWAAGAALCWLGLFGIGVVQIGFNELIPQLWQGNAFELPMAILLAAAAASIEPILRIRLARVLVAGAALALAALTVGAVADHYLPAGYALASVLPALVAASWIRQPIWTPAARSVLGATLLLDVLVLIDSSASGIGRALDTHGWLWGRPVQHLLANWHPVPVWPMLTLLAVTSVAGLARRSLLPTRTDPARWIVATTALVAVALSMNARPDVLVATAGWLAVAIGTALLAGRLTDSKLLVVPAVALGLAELTAVASDLSSIAAFGTGALLSVLVSWRFAERAVDRTMLELAAIGQLFVAVAAGIHHSWPGQGTPAVGGLLVCAGVFAVAAVLSPERRWWQWLAFSAVTVAIWIEAVLHEVHAPELYSVPVGVIVLAFGSRAAQRDEQLASWLAYGPGLLMLSVPSLVLGLQQPLSWRTTAVGVLALAMVLAGSRLRLQAPLLIGAAELTVVVLWELGPYALAMPRWAAIGAVGVLLLAIGITWENRLGNLRRAHQQLAGMR